MCGLLKWLGEVESLNMRIGKNNYCGFIGEWFKTHFLVKGLLIYMQLLIALKHKDIREIFPSLPSPAIF
jgi:hypothetical protein